MTMTKNTTIGKIMNMKKIIKNNKHKNMNNTKLKKTQRHNVQSTIPNLVNAIIMKIHAEEVHTMNVHYPMLNQED